MAEAIVGSPKAPALNALQRAWLREIGMEKVWLRQETPQPDPAGETAGARAGAGPRAEAVRSQARAVARETAPGLVPGSAPGSGSASQPSAASSESTASPLSAMSAAALAPGPQAPSNSPASGQDAEVKPPSALPRPAKPSTPTARTSKDLAPPSQPAPTAEALAMLDLATLRERVIECTACGLCRGRRQAVFGMGPEQARWLVVGEAPGEQEDRQGLPFVGRSGQLLDAMLAAVGMSRERDVYIANVIKCRPPGNRNPKPEEIAACRPYLMRQIALLKPERILVLGRFAAQTLLETDAAIGSLRGRVHTLQTDAGQIPMVVSYHPAYLLRSPGEKARAWQDLQLAIGL
ncbi:MAG TPA: uracil-DNA glycosylase family protein [Bordetella sp.]|nr:uracil-DNA glycosylase family protein [Bordetella sp.]